MLHEITVDVPCYVRFTLHVDHVPQDHAELERLASDRWDLVAVASGDMEKIVTAAEPKASFHVQESGVWIGDEDRNTLYED